MRKELIMNIIIFGAAGGTGRALTEQALEQGYTVTGFDRNPDALKLQHPNLTMLKGDIFDPAGVEQAIAGQDVVFCVLGVRPGVTIPVCSVGTKNIIAAMQKQGVKRLMVQSAFAVAALDGEWREVARQVHGSHAPGRVPAPGQPGLDHRASLAAHRYPCHWHL